MNKKADRTIWHSSPKLYKCRH